MTSVRLDPREQEEWDGLLSGMTSPGFLSLIGRCLRDVALHVGGRLRAALQRVRECLR